MSDIARFNGLMIHFCASLLFFILLVGKCKAHKDCFADERYVSLVDDERISQNDSSKAVRNKRAASDIKTIETAIYIDKELLQRFSGDKAALTRLVLAIMNEVQLIYNYKSMKTKIKIVITKLVFLNSSSDAPKNASGDIDQYLDNFCAWQAKKLRKESSSKRWDHALMLTG